mgnify:CR=1 FL=1
MTVEEAIEAIRNNEMKLYEMSDELTDNEEVVLAAIKEDRNALRYASERLKRDEKIVLAAIDPSTDRLYMSIMVEEYKSVMLTPWEEGWKDSIKYERASVIKDASEELLKNKKIR